MVMWYELNKKNCFLDNLDIFHIQWAKTLVNYTEFINQFNCPIILSLRGTQINVSPLVDENLASLYRQYFPKVSGFHAVSQSIMKEANKYGADTQKITVINPAVNEKLLEVKPYKSKKINSDKLRTVRY